MQKKDIISEIVLAATLVMANKILDSETLNKIWKELKMVNIFAFAHKKGLEEGLEEGALENSKEMVIEALEESIGIIPGYIADKINEIARKDTLKGLLRQAVKCQEISQFETSFMHLSTGRSSVAT